MSGNNASTSTNREHNSQTQDNATQAIPNVTQAFPNQYIILKSAGIRLPTIELPKFSGDMAEWLSFRDTFESLINKNETIDIIQKFHYLKASLEGSAAQIIKSLEFSANNYVMEWNAICGRFNNKRLLAHNHIKDIFSIKYMK